MSRPARGRVWSPACRGSWRFGLGSVQLHLDAFEDQEPAPDLGAFERMAGLGERLQLGDGAVQQLVHERVAHPLDGRLFFGGEIHLPEGAGELVATDLLRPVPELLY